MRRDIDALDDAGDDSFGPGTDLVFSVLAVLLVMLATLRITALLISGDTDLSFIQSEKAALLSELRKTCAEPVIAAKFEPGATVDIQTPSCDLKIVDNPQFQTMVFNESVLFDFRASVLKSQGAAVLGLVRQAMSARQRDIVEVQILGNTDTIGRETDNFQLGYQRALAVYNLLSQNAASDRIDPLGMLVSLTTYGYYNPVARRGRPDFSLKELNIANADEDLRGRNRRIELNIFYRKTAIH